MIRTMPSATTAPNLSAPTLPVWTHSLFTPRTRAVPRHNPLQLIDCLVFLLYAAILAFAIHHHLNSDDESQAWLLARDNPLSVLLLRRLHYEGAPALWPVLLWTAAHLHLPMASIHWIGAFFALAGIAVLLRFSPFPPVFRWLLPFTFFLQYQYAVIARPYTLFALLLFLLAIVYPLSKPRPILFALIAGLLANLSFHAAIIAGIFALLYLYDLLRRRSPASKPPAGRILAASGLLLIFMFLSAAAAFPAPDVATDGSPGDTSGTSHPFLRELIPPDHLPPGAPPIDAPLILNKPDTSEGGPAASQPSPALLFVVKDILLSADAAFYPISKSNLLALAFVLALFLWLRARHCARLLLPWAISIILSVQVFVYDHHSGQFLIALIAAVWIALELPAPAPPPSPRFALALTLLALLVASLQIGWTIHCVRAERFIPYDPGYETEAFLAQHFAGKRVAGFAYESVSTQGYADHNLFFNQPSAFWVWSAPTLINRRRTEALLEHPDAVVVGDASTSTEFFYNQITAKPSIGKRPFYPLTQFWLDHGYHQTHRFCGYRLMRMAYTAEMCEIVLEPDSVPAPAAPH